MEKCCPWGKNWPYQVRLKTDGLKNTRRQKVNFSILEVIWNMFCAYWTYLLNGCQRFNCCQKTILFSWAVKSGPVHGNL